MLRIKSEALKLGVSLDIISTSQKEVALITTKDSSKIALVTLFPDIIGDLKINSYLVNKPKYRWALAEGFSLNQMFKLKKEGVFQEVPCEKLANFLL